MVTRRGFTTQIGLTAAGAHLLTEAALAQRGLVRAQLAPDMVWLNANENPAGPPAASLEAMAKFREVFWSLYAA